MMGKHLNTEAWFDKTSTGSLRRKRVSKEREAQFPLRYRIVLQSRGPAALVKMVMKERGSTLAGTWEDVKCMVNGS